MMNRSWSRLIFWLALALLPLASLADEPLMPYGAYSSIETSNGEHWAGWEIWTWRRGPQLVGFVSFAEGLIGDESKIELREIEFDQASGNISFTAFFPDEDYRVWFEGKLSQNQITGTFSNSNGSVESDVVLKRCCDGAHYRRRYVNFDEMAKTLKLLPNEPLTPGSFTVESNRSQCAFDQQNQIELLRNLARSIPGSTLSVERREVSWESAEEGSTTFGYGGCADLGSVVTRSMLMPGPRSEQQVLKLAGELATRWWANEIVNENLAAGVLASALKEARFSVEEHDGKTFYEVSHRSFVELYVMHEYRDGVDVVSVAWQGNF